MSLYKERINVTEDGFFEVYVGVPKSHLLHGKKVFSLIPKSIKDHYKVVYKENLDLLSSVISTDFYSQEKVKEKIRPNYCFLKENFKVPFSISYAGKGYWHYNKVINFEEMTDVLTKEQVVTIASLRDKANQIKNFINIFVTYNIFDFEDVIETVLYNDVSYIKNALIEMKQKTDRLKSQDDLDTFKEKIKDFDKEQLSSLLNTLRALFQHFIKDIEEISSKITHKDYILDIKNLGIKVSSLEDDYWYFGFTNRPNNSLASSTFQGMDNEKVDKYLKYDLTEDEANEWLLSLKKQLEGYEKNKEIKNEFRKYYLEVEDFESLSLLAI